MSFVPSPTATVPAAGTPSRARSDSRPVALVTPSGSISAQDVHPTNTSWVRETSREDKTESNTSRSMSAARTTIFGVGVEASSSIDTMRCSLPSISLFGKGADSRMSGCGIDANTTPGMAEAISSRHEPGTKVRSSTISHCPPLTRTRVAPLLHSAHPSVKPKASRIGVTPSSARPDAMST